MGEAVAVPLWLLVSIAVLAAWTVLVTVLLPLLRWLFRTREKAAIQEINQRLDLQLPAFKLTKRKVLIDRLKYDPEILESIEEYCAEHSLAREEVMAKVAHYAREIVPAFNAYIYFRLGNYLSKRLARLLYRIRIGYADEAGIARIDRQSSVVFLMNHRSNMDYILLSYLTFNRVALSFAAGEWARFWPLQPLVRAMGAFFVRRGSGDPLYRKVLARYVQMAAEGGVVQAVYLEGGLSRDGKLREPKVGLLDYLIRNFNPEGRRDLVFIPAAVNYDRVLEDRSQLLLIDAAAKKNAPGKAAATTLSFIIRNIRQMIQGKWYRFGYAAVNFGTPVSMKDYTKTHALDFRNLDREERFRRVQALARELLAKIGRVIPVLPVSLIASVFVERPEKALSELELKAWVQDLIDELERKGAQVYIPRQDRNYAITVGLRMLTLRHLVLEEDNLYRVAPGELNLLHYYANAIAHLKTF